MEPENTTPPEPNKPFGPAAEASQPIPSAVPPTPVQGAPTTPPAPSAGGPAANPLPPTPDTQPAAPADQQLSPQPQAGAGVPTDPAVQPVSEGLSQPSPMPTPVSTKAPRNTSLPAILLAGVVIVFLVILAIYAFTKI
jgi:hypothetical protein